LWAKLPAQPMLNGAQPCTSREGLLRSHGTMPSVPRRKQIDDRPPLESRLDGELRLLHQRGLTNPQIYDLRALLGVARVLSATGTDLAKIESALAHAIEAYSDDAEIETARLWYGLQPKTRDTRNLSSTERTNAVWEYSSEQARQNGEKPLALSYYRTHLAKKTWKFLAEQLALAYEESIAQQPEAQRAASLHGARHLQVGLKTRLHTAPAAELFSDADRSPRPPGAQNEKMIVVKTRGTTYGFTKRFIHMRFHLVESLEILTLDLLLVLGVLLGIIVVIVLIVYFA
jgi:hypothetical protein